MNEKSKKFFGALKKVSQGYIKLVNDGNRWNIRCSADNKQFDSFMNYVQNGGLSKEKGFIEKLKNLCGGKTVGNRFNYNIIVPCYVYDSFFNDFKQFVNGFLDGDHAEFILRDFLEYINTFEQIYKLK